MDQADRLVIVDDTSPLIHYEGSSWFLDDTGSQDKKGNFGPVFNKTLHGTYVNASLSFSFSGTGFRILGTNNVHNNSGILDPAWECFIDGVKVKSTPFQFFENNWGMCGSDELDLMDASHTVTLNVTVQGSVPFFFDKIHYAPSPSVDLDDKTVYVRPKDPALQGNQGWGSWGGTALVAAQPNAPLIFDFYGVSVSWYGYITRSSNSSTGVYAIDDNPLTPFTLEAHPTGATQYNMEFFRTPDFPKGQHRLTVSSVAGDTGSTPLILDYLVIRNSTSHEDQDPSVSIIPTTDSKPNQKSGPSAGAITGGVLGGLAMLLLGILIFVYISRRSKQRWRSAQNGYPSVPQSGTEVGSFTREYTSLASFDHHPKRGVQISSSSPSRSNDFNSKFRQSSRDQSPSPFAVLRRNLQPQFHANSKFRTDAVLSPARLEERESLTGSLSVPFLNGYQVTEFLPDAIDNRNLGQDATYPVNLSRHDTSLHDSPDTVVVHQDSGLRNLDIPQSRRVVPLEIPPLYSMQ
ncbi:hypothetical protein CVT24_011168 [Panaeolus cyanescens]|uniref:Transmembrane protein n=1 Tax=Panaeolus cyanescens TaxID=181874 RepID=A0A409YGC1_9AGAR|nr:hypothetical protein CVT24_011168 [Panaeolus cyanescens]